MNKKLKNELEKFLKIELLEREIEVNANDIDGIIENVKNDIDNRIEEYQNTIEK